MGKKITTAIIRDALGTTPDAVTKYKGVYTYRRGFFFTMGCTSKKVSCDVSKALTEAGIVHAIVDFGQQWRTFRGGDTLKQGSHWWVKFTVSEG